MAKVFTAGMSDIDPMAKQQISEQVHNRMDGPTWPMAFPMFFSIVSFDLCGMRLYACTKMKMLSTPMASTRNGMTWGAIGCASLVNKMHGQGAVLSYPTHLNR